MLMTLEATMHRAASFTVLLVTIAACGGGEEEVPKEILPASEYAARCDVPRKGIDPTTGQSYVDTDGSVLDERLWLRSWTDDTYLWYKEVPGADPKAFKTTLAYFDILKTGAVTPSGKDKDRFHFTYKTTDWVQLSQSGVEASYGLSWVLIQSYPPRNIVAANVQPGSPAALAGIARGTKVTMVDGADAINGGAIDTLNAGLFPSNPDETHTLMVIDPGGTAPHPVTVKSANIELAPVQRIALPAPNDKVGYLVFNDHIATAEKGLVEAVTQLRDAGVEDLVLDIRYNGGGYLDIASELAYMIAGPTATAGKFFDRETFNDKHTTTDPITGQTIEPVPFATKTIGFSLDRGAALPVLNLHRVFVLTGSGTCSASEAVMNGLAGADIEVIQIGATTCGKPYGFYPADNCGTTYFSIQFRGVNAKGFGDYADGFVPGGVLKGCVVPDDFSHALGDPAEARLAAALAYRTTSACPTVAAMQSRRAANPLSATEGVMPKPLWRQNMIATPRRHTP
jgi:hypothetical protein